MQLLISQAKNNIFKVFQILELTIHYVQNVQNVFKPKQKTNLPKNTSSDLKSCLSAIKSDLKDPKGRRKFKPNLPKDELVALQKLIQLQRDKQIVIKKADKGAGLVILDYDQYLQSSYDHLFSSQTQADGSKLRYYEESSEYELTVTKKKIKKILDAALEQKLISETDGVSSI